MNLYTTSVYKRLEELHPNLWEIQEFIGAEKADQLISAYVDDEGHLSPHPINDWFSPPRTKRKNWIGMWKSCGTN